MNPNRYSFECQRAFLQGLQVATSMGHEWLEIEHVVVFLAEVEGVPLGAEELDDLRLVVREHLKGFPKHYSNKKPQMGGRLKTALRRIEDRTGDQKVQPAEVWRAILEDGDLSELMRSGPRGVPELSGAEAGSTEGAQREARREAGRRQKESAAEKEASQRAEVLSEFTVDVTQLAHEDKLDPVFGRSTELRRTIETLGRKRKNNPLLLGEPGVGKTAIVEALAQSIVSGDVPESLKDRRILSLDLAALLAGSRYRGQFEERLKNLVGALKDLEGNVLLFIDEVHTIMGAGGGEGSTDAANLLKPALARGELHVVAATTLAEFKKYIEKDPAFERRFQPIVVDEPSGETCLAMLRGLKSKYERHHGVRISDDALESAVPLSVRYLNDRRLPDKAIDLMDEAASRLRIEIESMPRVMSELKASVDQYEMQLLNLGRSTRQQKKREELEASLAGARKDFEVIERIVLDYRQATDDLKALLEEEAELRYLAIKATQHGSPEFASETRESKLPELQRRIHEQRQVLHRFQTEHAFLKREVGVREIAQVLSEWAGMPVGTVLEDGKDKLRDLPEVLGARVFGQAPAVEVMVQLIKRAQVGLNDPGRPTGVVLFLGPSGVGKTELAKAVAEQLYGGTDRLLRFDMSEFNQPHQVARLVGSPPGYVGHGEGGELSEAIRRKPNSVVLLDEIDKAHPKAWDILLQVFDEGRLTDSEGRHIDCRSCLFVMTSNFLTGSGTFHAAEGAPPPEEEPTFDEGEVRKRLTEVLRPEFVNRIQNVVRFRDLGPKELQRVLVLLQNKLNDQLKARGLRIELSEAVREELIEASYREGMGARSIQRLFDRRVRDAIVDQLFGETLEPGDYAMELDEERQMVFRGRF